MSERSMDMFQLDFFPEVWMVTVTPDFVRWVGFKKDLDRQRYLWIVEIGTLEKVLTVS